MKSKEVNQLYQAILAACSARSPHAIRIAEMHYYAALRAWLRRHDQPVTLLLPATEGVGPSASGNPPSGQEQGSPSNGGI